MLECGHGRGEVLEAFSKRWITVYGIDREVVSDGYLAPHRILKVDMERDRFPFEDGYFDVVFSKSVIEHCHDPSHFLAESFRVLAPGGRLIVMTPDWKSQMEIFYDDFTHRTPFTPDGLSDALEMFGIREVKVEKFYQLPIVWKYPALKWVCRFLQLIIPVRWKLKNKFLRWSVELMILGTGVRHTP